MRFTPNVQTAAIIAVGSFNPAIFHPSWLCLHGVISSEELEIAEKSIAIIHPEISEFSVDTLAFQVTPQRISIKTTETPFVKIADMMTVIFGDFLNHTPIQKVGINFQIDFSLETAKRRVALGRALAPLEPWGDWAKSLDVGASLKDLGGLRALSLEQWKMPDRLEGSYRRVQIEPSLLHNPPRLTDVYMMVNDHYELEAAHNTDPFIKVLQERFDISIAESAKIVSDLMDFAERLT